MSPISDLTRPTHCLLVVCRLARSSHRQPLISQTTCHASHALSSSSVLRPVTVYSVFHTSYVALQAPYFSRAVLTSYVLPLRSLLLAAAEKRRVHSQLLRSSVASQLLPHASCHFPPPSDRVTMPFTCHLSPPPKHIWARISPPVFLSVLVASNCIFLVLCVSDHVSRVAYLILGWSHHLCSRISWLQSSSLVSHLLSCMVGSLTWYIFLFVCGAILLICFHLLRCHLSCGVPVSESYLLASSFYLASHSFCVSSFISSLSCMVGSLTWYIFLFVCGAILLICYHLLRYHLSCGVPVSKSYLLASLFFLTFHSFCVSSFISYPSYFLLLIRFLLPLVS